MEHDQKNLINLSELFASQPLKKMVTHFVVSVSIFSLVFSWSTLRSSHSILMYYEKLHCFSWNSLQLLTIVMNKNCIFLIFNGILVFLAKTSAFVRSPSSFDLNEMLQKRIGDGLQIETELETPILETNVMLEESSAASTEKEEEVEEEEENKEETKVDEEVEEFECLNEKAEEVSISIAESDDDDDEEGGGISVHEDVGNGESEPKNCWLFDDDDEQIYAEEEDDDDDDEMKKLSTEELNQKFEDFIRRTKEEFRINEARQQLVMVN